MLVLRVLILVLILVALAVAVVPVMVLIDLLGGGSGLDFVRRPVGVSAALYLRSGARCLPDPDPDDRGRPDPVVSHLLRRLHPRTQSYTPNEQG